MNTGRCLETGCQAYCEYPDCQKNDRTFSTYFGCAVHPYSQGFNMKHKNKRHGKEYEPLETIQENPNEPCVEPEVDAADNEAKRAKKKKPKTNSRKKY
jgi:hypothetical protein